MARSVNMKKIRSAIIGIAFVAAVFVTGAKAYDVNYSHVNPAAYRTQWTNFCPLAGQDIGPKVGNNILIGSHRIGCEEQYACDGSDDDHDKDDTCTRCECNNHINTYAGTQYQYQKFNDFFTTNMCYRLSCYYQAMAYTNLNYVVQPLNKHANIVRSIISQYASDGRLTSQTGVHGVASDTGLGPISDGGKWAKRFSHKSLAPDAAGGGVISPNGDLLSYRHYQNGKYNSDNTVPGEIIPSPREIKLYEPGGGTSAFQGIVWSWRMLSNKWNGKWANQSYYEAQGLFPDGQADRATKLPSAELSKHIIVISDGIDNDGLDNAAVVAADNTNAQPGIVLPNDPAYTAARTDSGFGFDFNPLDSRPGRPQGETCDAHAPEASITKEDYVKVCEEMTKQGITVYAIVFDDVVNEKLKACVLATERGVYIDNANICSASVTTASKCQDNPTGVASPAYLKEALTKVFAAIAAQSVRLVE